jgi:hypothetical protein
MRQTCGAVNPQVASSNKFSFTLGKCRRSLSVSRKDGVKRRGR